MDEVKQKLTKGELLKIPYDSVKATALWNDLFVTTDKQKGLVSQLSITVQHMAVM